MSEQHRHEWRNLNGVIFCGAGSEEDDCPMRYGLLTADRANALERVAAAARSSRLAIVSLQTMRDAVKPQKLDAALGWRENDELANVMAANAIAKLDEALAALDAADGGTE